MTIDDKVSDEKLQYDINREAAKISALSSGKTDKYEYLTGEEILLSNRGQIIEQAKFTYSPLEKASENQTGKQVDALKSLDLSNKTDELKQIQSILPKYMLNDSIFNKLKEIIKLQDIVKTDELCYKSKRRKIFNFSEYSLAIVFLKDVHEGYLSLKDADDEQIKFANKLPESESESNYRNQNQNWKQEPKRRKSSLKSLLKS